MIESILYKQIETVFTDGTRVGDVLVRQCKLHSLIYTATKPIGFLNCLNKMLLLLDLSPKYQRPKPYFRFNGPIKATLNYTLCLGHSGFNL